jgi:hypothetical protein
MTRLSVRRRPVKSDARPDCRVVTGSFCFLIAAGLRLGRAVRQPGQAGHTVTRAWPPHNHPLSPWLLAGHGDVDDRVRRPCNGCRTRSARCARCSRRAPIRRRRRRCRPRRRSATECGAWSPPTSPSDTPIRKRPNQPAERRVPPRPPPPQAGHRAPHILRRTWTGHPHPRRVVQFRLAPNSGIGQPVTEVAMARRSRPDRQVSRIRIARHLAVLVMGRDPEGRLGVRVTRD